jgi:uncharacterized protein YajQ (UPF0234 family)
MSEAKSRFRIKNGEIEIEYEGLVKDTNDRYKEALDWVKSAPRRGGTVKVEETGKEPEERKKGTRGPEIWSPAIDNLINEGYFKLPNKRDNKAVMKALEDKALPVKGKAKIILQTLMRKVRKGDLKGTHTTEGWVFWTE